MIDSGVNTKMIVGPSLGWACVDGIPLEEQGEAVKNSELITAVEIVLLTLDPDDRHDVRLKALLANDASVFGEELDFVSSHLPDYEEGANVDTNINIIKELIERYGIEAVVIHPLKIDGQYPVEYYNALTGAGIPLGIENMDRDKKSGFDVKELERLVECYSLGLVIDTQHASEWDSLMMNARSLAMNCWQQLTHFHVSGRNQTADHSLVNQAENQWSIVAFLSSVFIDLVDMGFPRLPIILEGRYRSFNDIGSEIDFLIREAFADA